MGRPFLRRCSLSFASSETELESLAKGVKALECPHCRCHGTLNNHGRMRDKSGALRGAAVLVQPAAQEPSGLRAHLFCVRLASVLARHSVGAGKLAEFLTAWQRLGGKVLAAWEAVRTGFSTDSAYRWAKKLCPQSGRGPRAAVPCACPAPTDRRRDPCGPLRALGPRLWEGSFHRSLPNTLPRALACRGRDSKTRIVRRKSKMEAKK